jgi:hypothetical protein
MQVKFIQAGPSKILQTRKKQEKKVRQKPRNKKENLVIINSSISALSNGVWRWCSSPFLFPIAQRSDDGTQQNLGGRRVGEKLRNSEEINQEVRERKVILQH